MINLSTARFTPGLTWISYLEGSGFITYINLRFLKKIKDDNDVIGNKARYKVLMN